MASGVSLNRRVGILYHNARSLRITRLLVSCQPVCSASKAVDEREMECLVELLTQSLFDPGVDEADQTATAGSAARRDTPVRVLP